MLWEIGGSKEACFRFVNSMSAIEQALDKKRSQFRYPKCGTSYRERGAGPEQQEICEQQKILRQLKAAVS